MRFSLSQGFRVLISISEVHPWMVLFAALQHGPSLCSIHRTEVTSPSSTASSLYLDQGPHNTKTGEPEVLKRSGLAHSVEKGIQKQWNVGWKKEKKRSCKSCREPTGFPTHWTAALER